MRWPSWVGSSNTRSPSSVRAAASSMPSRAATCAELDASALVEADQDGVGRRVGAVADRSGGQDPLGEHCGFGGGLGGRVELFEGEHAGCVGVVAEPAHLRAQAPHHVVAGVGVLAAGAAPRVPVERTELGGVGVVAGAEVVLQLAGAVASSSVVAWTSRSVVSTSRMPHSSRSSRRADTGVVNGSTPATVTRPKL